jgi:cell division transport system ATP-binding protein
MIHFKSVSKIYDNDVFALKGIEAHIQKGEFIFVTGSSGAGKSTLLKLIYGGLKPSDGSVVVGGSVVDELSSYRLAMLRRQMGIVFQDFKLLWDRSVVENVCLPFYVWGKLNSENKELSELMMKKFDIWKYRNEYPHKLSGGEQQKVAICRALVTSPWILIADEPTGNLDPKSAEEVFKMFYEAAQRGSTVIFATHNEHLLSLHKGRVLKLDKGRLA